MESDGKYSELFLEFKNIATENNIRRLDDDYLQRFLVGHRYDVPSALKAIRNFQSFVDRRQKKWLKLEKNVVEALLDSQIIDILDCTGRQGQKVAWIRLEKWNPDIFTPDQILEVSGLLCELLYRGTKEVKCIDIIMDMHKFSLKHICSLSGKFAKRMIFFMSECLPMELSHVYVVRQPAIFHLGYALYKPFVDERMKNIIHICGNNYESLVQNIGRDRLPPVFDGIYQNPKSSRWINMMYQKQARRDLSLAGYEFYEKS